MGNENKEETSPKGAKRGRDFSRYKCNPQSHKNTKALSKPCCHQTAVSAQTKRVGVQHLVIIFFFSLRRVSANARLFPSFMRIIYFSTHTQKFWTIQLQMLTCIPNSQAPFSGYK